MIIVKTKIVLTERAEQITVGKDAEKEIKKSIYLMLREKGFLSQKQYEECLKRENR